ncbi:hypothetical protein [uncultured Shimia sp.]|uniref:hypothetical protein n=1 Tax=uncultured Shimia sp. TaxID=573152 RepID=UPI002635567D|nr:hypothetical protein [uncultured Shimia sp.]
MNKTIIALLAVGILAIGAFALMPEEEPTVQDKLNEARESLTEAADLAKVAVEEKAEQVSSELEEQLNSAKKSTLEIVEELQESATQTALDMSKLRDDIKREFEAGGSLNMDGYNPSRAAAALKDIGLDGGTAKSISDWLADLYRTPEQAEAAISQFLETLKSK